MNRERIHTHGMINATVLILAKNEEDTIGRVVQSAAEFARVVVIDSSSTDRTVELAEASGAEVIQFSWDGRYPKKKEWSASHPIVETDWVVLLDADEELSKPLIDELRAIIDGSRGPADAVDVPIRYVWQGRELRHGHVVIKRIAYRRSRAQWPHPDDLSVRSMWEVEGHYQPIIAGRIVRAKSRLRHDDTGSLYDYFARHNRYTDWEAWVLERRVFDAIQTRTTRGRLAARLPFKPVLFLVYAFIARAGFLDGKAGWSYAVAMSYYHWQVGLKRSELRRLAAISYTPLYR